MSSLGAVLRIAFPAGNLVALGRSKLAPRRRPRWWPEFERDFRRYVEDVSQHPRARTDRPPP